MAEVSAFVVAEVSAFVVEVAFAVVVVAFAVVVVAAVVVVVVSGSPIVIEPPSRVTSAVVLSLSATALSTPSNNISMLYVPSATSVGREKTSPIITAPCSLQT